MKIDESVNEIRSYCTASKNHTHRKKREIKTTPFSQIFIENYATSEQGRLLKSRSRDGAATAKRTDIDRAILRLEALKAGIPDMQIPKSLF